MSHFPDPIVLPEKILEQRQERKQHLVKSCVRGIIIRLAIILAEFAGVLIFGSASLLMDAIASFVDVFSSLALVLFIKLADRPPDKDHPFGHGRYEPLIGMQLGIFMAVIGAVLLFQQTYALGSSSNSEGINPYTWIIPFGAVILLECSYQIVMRTAKQQNSPALAADAVHYRIDGVTSFLAAAALFAGAYIPHLSVSIDHFGAIIIALLMVGIGINAARNNVGQIMDKAPEPSYFERVSRAAKRVPGVLDTEKMRIQMYGPDAHIDIDIEVEPNQTVEVAHEISQKVRVEIQKEWPQVRDVTVHIEPYYPGDH